MIIDGFSFYNEFDLLECRLEYLYHHVDKFILSECNLTHAGNPKPLYFLENTQRYQKYLDKILYAPLFVNPKNYNFTRKISDCDYDTDFWAVERLQKNNIATMLGPYPDDTILLVGDLDEIPNIEVFPQIQKELETYTAVCLLQQSFYYNLKYRHPNYAWPLPAAAKKKEAIARTVNGIRAIGMHVRHVNNGGWHLSYFMDPSLIQNKLKNFAHQEYNNDQWTNEDRIIDCMRRGLDPLGRFQLEQTDRNEFPEHFMRVFGKYYT